MRVHYLGEASNIAAYEEKKYSIERHVILKSQKTELQTVVVENGAKM